MTENSTQFYLSSLSHEIRTPLNGVLGYCQLLSQTKLDVTQQTYTNRAMQCCLELVEIVNDVLDFSRLMSGKATLNNQCFSFKEITDEVTSVLSQRIKEKKQKIRYILDEKLPEYIIADKQKIVQILINLVSNANKFSPVGSRILLQIETSDSQITFSVEDNGIGMSKEEQDRIFMPFVQINPSTTKNGSGLGLAISRKLVEILGGKINVESEKGKGSVFTFGINYEPYEHLESKINKSKDIQDKHILIVDDNVDSRLFLEEMLFELKARPVVCSSSKEALRYISAKRYPFVGALIDICISDMPGTVLAKQIKDIDPSIPLVALSSLEDPFDMTNFEQVLKKPINKLKLFDTLCRVIDKSNVTQFELNSVKEETFKVQKDVKILVAEDNTYNLDMIVKMLANMGYKNVDTACDGEETINKLEEHLHNGDSYDILLLDLKMPKVSGFGVAEHMKLNKYSSPKVAVITASVLENDREKCKDLGIKYFLLKPFSISHLKNIINRLIYGTTKI